MTILTVLLLSEDAVTEFVTSSKWGFLTAVHLFSCQSVMSFVSVFLFSFERTCDDESERNREDKHGPFCVDDKGKHVI